MSRSLRSAVGAIVLIACGISLFFASHASAQTPQLIVDLLTAPQKHWNTTVLVKGHVRTVTPNPPGTNRGTFVFRDSSDADITVVTSELPSIGKEYTITAIVEQETPDATVPVLKELSRRVGTAAVAPAEPATPKPVPAPKDAVTPPTPAPPVPTAAPSPAPAAPAPAAAPAGERIFGVPTLTLYGAIIVLAIIALASLGVFRSKPVPQPDLEPRVIVQPPPAAPQLSASAPAPAAADPGNQATRFVPPKPVAAAAATVVYVDLGADLVVTEGPDTGKKFPLTKPRITIGRHGARQNDVELGDQSVSREHAKIVYNPTDQTFNLINESVTNPTRVNDTAIDSRLLQPNDLIVMGATTIKFVRRNAGSSA